MKLISNARSYQLAEREGLIRAILALTLRAHYVRQKTASCYFFRTIILTSRVRMQDPTNWRRERDSNPRYGMNRIHTFQACAFSRSAISPERPFYPIFAPDARAI